MTDLSQFDDSAGRADAQESIRRAAEVQMGRSDERVIELPDVPDDRVRCRAVGQLACGHAVQCTLLADHSGPHLFATEWNDPQLDGMEG